MIYAQARSTLTKNYQPLGVLQRTYREAGHHRINPGNVAMLYSQLVDLGQAERVVIHCVDTHGRIVNARTYYRLSQ